MMNDIICHGCKKRLGKMSFDFAVENCTPDSVFSKIMVRNKYVCTLLCDECAKEEQQNIINIDDIPEPE